MQFVAFDAVKNQVELTQYLDRIGWEPIQGNRTEKRGHCPICESRSRRRQPFCVNTIEQVFYCHSCRAMGDVIDFASQYLNVELQEAASIIAKDFDLKLPTYSEWRKGRW